MSGTTVRTTDLGNAERLIALHRDDLRFVGTWKTFLVWDGRRWKIDDDGGALRCAIDTARILVAEALKEMEVANALYAAAPDDPSAAKARSEADRFFKWAVKSQGKDRLTAMLAIAAAHAALAITHERLDGDPFLLNCANGTIDLSTGALREHRRDDLITKLAPVAFDSAAQCPEWEAFLARILPDENLVSYVQRIYGYALTGSTREHVVAFQYGSGANGKSTANGTIHEMLGDYAAPAPRGLLFRSRSERHPTELASLHGRRFVTCSEISEGQVFDEALLKDLSGGDPISARRMRENFWSFMPTHKFFLAGNHKPIVRGDDEGIWRRLRLIPFAVTIPPAERDPELPLKLRRELPGILAWCVRGCVAWQRKGLGDPPLVREATADYRRESDAVGEFLTRYLTFEAGAVIARKTVRRVYVQWCEETGHEALGAKRFSGRLRDRGVIDTSVRLGELVVDGWRNVRLATTAELEERLANAGRSDFAGTASSNDRSNEREDEGNPFVNTTSPYDPAGDGERAAIRDFS